MKYIFAIVIQHVHLEFTMILELRQGFGGFCLQLPGQLSQHYLLTNIYFTKRAGFVLFQLNEVRSVNCASHYSFPQKSYLFKSFSY